MATLVYANPGPNSASAGGIGWVDFGSGFTISPGQTISGLTASFLDGSTVTFDISSQAVVGPGQTFAAVVPPTFGGAAFGTQGYLGITNNVALYAAQPSTVDNETTRVTVNNIVVKDPQGNPITNYNVVVADGESTDATILGGVVYPEQLVMTTNGTPWNLVQMIPNGVSVGPTISGLGTNTFTELGMLGLGRAPVVDTQGATSVSVESIEGKTSKQGFVIGFAINKVTIKKNITARINPADQFTLSIGGTPSNTATTTGAATGLQTVTADVFGIVGNTYTVNESMAAGSVTPLSGYEQTVTVVNLATGGQIPIITPLPESVTLALGDVIEYTITNRAINADVSITKAAAPSPVVAGNVVTYTLTASNAGPDPAQNVTVTDTLPAGIQTQEYSIDGGASWSPWMGSVNVGTLTSGASQTVLVRGTVNPSVLGNLVNTVTVSSTTPDFNQTNNTATVTTPITTSADMQIVKTFAPNPVVPGQSVTYTLVVTNLGPSTALNVSVVDAIAATLLNPQYTLNGGVSQSWSGSLVLGTVLPNIVNTIQITGTVASSATGSLANTATVSSTTPDPNQANNTSTITAPLVPSADLSITKSTSPSPVVAGQLVTYTLIVENAGPSDAQSVLITDAVPATLLTPEYSVDGGNTWNLWVGSVNVGTVPVGEINTILIRGTVVASATGTLTNTATVTSPTPDPNLANNTATVTDLITTLADVSIVKTNVSGSVVAGNQVEYSLVVANAGPSNAQNVVVNDVIPANIQNPEYSLDGGTNWILWTGSLLLGTVGVGGTPITILIRGTVRSSATGTLTNTATVTSTTPDPNPSNNTSTVTNTVNTSADLAITKVGSPNPVTAGSQITYTIVVTDNGPSDAQSVSLTDQVAANIQNPQYSLDGGTTWLTWMGSLNIGTVVVGAPKTVRIRGTVSSTATGDLTNTASVTSPTPDPNPNNNTVTIRTLVNNVAIVKSSPVTGAEVGDTIPYVLTITNKGEVTAESIIVTDVLVPELSYADNLRLNGNPIGGNITQGVGIGDLFPGQSAILSFDATVVAIPTGKIINNQATADYQYRATSTEPPIPGTVTSNIYPVRIYAPSLQVTKQADVPSNVVGEPFSYTINVTNTGDIAVDHVILTDALPTSFVVQSITVDNVAVGGNLGTGIDIGTIAIGQTKVVKVRIIINDTVDISSFKNVAVATGTANVDPAFPPRPVTATGTDNTGIDIYNPKLTLVKSADKSYAIIGDIVTYTIKATNTGNVNLNNIQLDSVTVSDLLSSELAFVEGSGTLDGVSLPNASILAGVNMGSILVNQTKTITFKVKVVSDTVTLIENTALGEFRYTLPGRPTQTKTAESNPYDLNVRKTGLTLVKTADKEEAGLGDVITYTVKVTNTGNLIAYDVLFTDTLPPQVELVPGSFMIGTQVVNSVDLAKGVTIAYIAPGETVSLTYQVKVVGTNCSGELINQAQVKFEYRFPDGTGETLTVTGSTSSTVVNLTLTTFKQMSIESYLIIPEVKPDMEAINVVTGTIDSISCHVINTPQSISTEGQTLTGYKLIIKGILNVVVEYTALEATQSVHSAHYTVPFSAFIVLPPTFVIGSKFEVSGLVEDIYFNAVDTRTFFTNTTALINVKILSC